MKLPVIQRRHFLSSSTAMIALPVLDSLGFRRFAAAAAAATPPKRLLFLGFGWGITTESWFPDIKQPGTDYTLPDGLKPLARHKSDFTIVQNLWNKYSNEGHWGSTMWLSGANRFAEPGQTFHNSISADQVAAAELGLATRFASIQLNGSESGDASGHGPGLSMAWDVSGKPVAGLNGPLPAYSRLFMKDTTPIEQQKAMLAEQRSVLDEYFQGIRDIETRLSKDEQWLGVPQPKTDLPEPPPGLAGREEIKLMYDIIVAAIQTDSTRVLTYRQPVSTLLTSIGIKVAPHDMSHYHSTMGEKLVASQQRDLTQSELLAGLIDKLKATKEADGSRLFDHVALAYGSNIRTEHNLDNCPTLLTGGGAGIKLGHNLVVSKNTPLCNAWLTLLHGIGVDAVRHGDSTGVIKELIA